jgi:hypothetical protein
VGPRSADLFQGDLDFGDGERLLSLERVRVRAANAGGNALHFSGYSRVPNHDGSETVPQGVPSNLSFPAVVRGPVLRRALRLFAAIFASDVMGAHRM